MSSDQFARDLETLAQVSRELTATRELVEVIARMAVAARRFFGVRRVAVFLRDPLADTLACVASAADDGPTGWVGRVLPAGVGVAGRAVTEGRPVWSRDLSTDSRIPVADWLRERLAAEGLRSVAAAPLVADGETLGALGLLDGPGRIFSETDLQLLGVLAGHGAMAVREARRAERPG
ncbi:MAG TPA: GAF domain-containing protein [Methylomirabilota bacterium]|jgi:GAF domain-containing protein|nr:GAF domain-containing protein [Methylomirabilota bacterium]